MGKKIGKQTVVFDNRAQIVGKSAIVGAKEGQGNFGKYFDNVLKYDDFGEDTFEKAERKMLEFAISKAMEDALLEEADIDLMLCGDLLNQIISSSFAARNFDFTFLGMYGACSTMAETIAVGSCFMDAGYFNNVICATGSHFSTAERQYRNPLELGNQRPHVSQWTVTGAGCTILGHNKTSNIYVNSATFGKVTDFGIKDVNNMGAAMAPSAMSTMVAHFEDTKTNPEYYDLIITGDLGKLGSEILLDLMENKGYKLGVNYNDCGHMMFNSKQKTFQGASGAGCSATILNSYVFNKMNIGSYKRVLFVATGALLCTLSSQQGETIPGISHAVEFCVGV